MQFRGAAGASLVEVLVALAITLVVTAVACVMVIDTQAAWQGDSARVDLQQRARVAADTLTRALREAGLGSGPPAMSPLIHVVPPVIPRRTGASGAHPADAFEDATLTIRRVVQEAEYAYLTTDLPPGAGVLDITTSPGCAAVPCGLVPGAHVMVLDPGGDHDLFTVLRADGPAVAVRHHGPGNAAAYPAGSPVVPVQSSTFYLDHASRVLREYNGDTSDLPVLDDVVEMRVEYYGAAHPPKGPRPAAGEANCLYAADGTYHEALMPVLPAPAGLVALDAALLTDGPWCGTGSNAFDADLLRVRRVRVTLRLQSTDPAARGADPARFRNTGTARAEASLAPDVTVAVDVSLRNAVAGW